MTESDQFELSPEEFSGTVRLFPLPDLVLFPHVVQPLHVFEPRYCELLRESLEDDRLIAVAALMPGWEADYEGEPPIARVACLGRVIVHRPLDDGTHNILLAGLSRIEITRELSTARSFRVAEAVLREDRCSDNHASRVPDLLARLQQVLRRMLPFVAEGQQQLDELLEREVSLGTLTDLVAYLLDVDLAEKLALLGEDDVLRRAEILTTRLTALTEEHRGGGRRSLPFPPVPSRN